MKRRFLKVLGVIFILFLLIQLIPPKKVTDYNPYMIKNTGRPLVIAHGGAKVLYPENTMVAFDGSADMDVDMLEMDVRITKDGILVTHHDLTIDRMSDGEGKVSQYTYDELLKFNFGHDFVDLKGDYPYRESPVLLPKLEDVFKKHGNFPMVVEIKDDGDLGIKASQELKRLIYEYNMDDKIIIASFNDDVLKYFKEITNDSILTSTANDESGTFVKLNIAFLDLFYFGNDEAIQIPLEHSGVALDKKRLINSAQRRNMVVHYWTINDPEEMKHLIELGADGIITDRPDLMQNVLKEMGY